MTTQIYTLEQACDVLSGLKQQLKDNDIRLFALAHGYIVRIRRVLNSMSNLGIEHHESPEELIAEVKKFLKDIA